MANTPEACPGSPASLVRRGPGYPSLFGAWRTSIAPHGALLAAHVGIAAGEMPGWTAARDRTSTDSRHPHTPEARGRLDYGRAVPQSRAGDQPDRWCWAHVRFRRLFRCYRNGMPGPTFQPKGGRAARLWAYLYATAGRAQGADPTSRWAVAGSDLPAADTRAEEPRDADPSRWEASEPFETPESRD